jgi:hypothetical protein
VGIYRKGFLGLWVVILELGGEWFFYVIISVSLQ